MSQKIRTSVDIDGSLTTNEFGISVGHIKLDTTPTNIPTSLGTIYWDEANRTAALIDGDGDTTLQLGQEQRALVHNNTGSTLTDGQIVYVTGSTGEVPSVTLASSSVESTSATTLGMVTETIAHGSHGFITISGIVHGLNTLAFNEGDMLWLGTTPGTFTSTKPISPNHLVLIGYVVKKAGGNGSVFVKIQNTQELSESSDVLFTSLTNNDILAFEGGSVNLWKNKTISTVLGYTPANDSNVVHKTGDETIAGSKTFTTAVSINKATANTDAVLFKVAGNQQGRITINNDSGFDLFTSADDSGYGIKLDASDSNGILFYAANPGMAKFIVGENYNISQQDFYTIGNIDGDNVYSDAFYSRNNSSYYLIPSGSSNLYNVTANQFIKSGGTSSQFLKADGSVDSNSYALASSLSSYVPNSRTITINGTSYDLSANRSWTVTANAVETDTLATVTARGASTSTLSTFDGGLNIGNAKLRWGTNSSPTLGFPFTGGPNAFWIDVNDGDTGGIAIDNDGTTIYGAGDSGHVFRVIDEDVYQGTSNIDASTTFRIQQGQNGGGYVRGVFEVTDYLTAGNSARAPIFYDSNDTTYYSDLASTSQTATRQRGGTVYGPNTTWGAYLLVGGNGRTSYIDNALTASVCATDGNIHLDAGSGKNMYFNWYDGSAIIFGNGAESQIGYMSSSGDFTANSSSRSPIFYDSNNTGYYVDPNNSSRVNTINADTLVSYGVSYASGTGGFASSTYAAGQRNPIWRFGNADGYGLSYFQGTAGQSGQDTIGFHFGTATSAGSQFWMRGDGAFNCAMANTTSTTSSPIYYDYNNTGYYLDPASTSYINVLQLANKMIVGSFPQLQTNTGEAWIGRAADRNTGSLTVQLGGNSSSGRVFEVIDYAWTISLFNVTSAGNATAYGDITAYSDRRVKENINTIDDALNKVLSLRGVTYNRIDSEDKSEKIGVIAQEIQEVLPQVVHEQENGMLGVSYGNITAVLIEAIKEQQTQIEELKQLFNTLINK